MAAPTNFRVEAVGQNTTFLRWKYTGTSAVVVYRSTDGSAYAIVAGSGTPPATKSYIDTELTSGTKYWYKLSDDVGVTFSAVKTVVTHTCGDELSKKKGFHLPRFAGGGGSFLQKRKASNDRSAHEDWKAAGDEPVSHEKLSKAMRDIEDVIKKNVFHQQPCEVCVVDGAIIIDCADGCDCYNVDASVDINSISFVNCEGIDPCIHFRVPPGPPPIGICGWPQGHSGFTTQFGGDECEEAPIDGGDDGRTVTTGGLPPESKPGSGQGGGSGSGSGCECLASSTGGLTVKCCTDDCSLDCQSTKSLEIRICGGTGPYTINGGASGLQLKTRGGAVVAPTDEISADQVIVITPPVNTGSAEVGTAYIQGYAHCFTCTAGVCTARDANGFKAFNCDDTAPLSCVAGTPAGCTLPALPAASGMKLCRADASCTCLSQITGATTCEGVIYSCDARTAPMIAAGCVPCGLSTDATFTVTDASGVAVVTAIG